MRKMTILFLALVLVAAVTVGVLGSQVYADHDQVALTQKIYLGDESMVDDVTLRLRTHYNYHLFWDTTYRPGTAPEIETDYRFCVERDYEPWQPTYFGVRLESYMESISMYGLEETPLEDSGLTLAYQELAEITAAGEERSKEIYLKDYMDYYPINVEFSFPQYSGSVDLYSFTDEDDLVPDTGRDAARVLQEYFRIPVLDNERMTISIEKNSNGQVFSSGLSSGLASDGTNSDFFRLYTTGDWTEDACYFTFDAHSEDGVVIDLRLLPDGYGIYRLPLKETAQNTCPVDAGGLDMVYPLDPAVHILSLGVAESGDTLLLYTVENDTFCLTVIDIRTMETQQKLELIQTGDWPGYLIYEGESYIAIFFGQEDCLLVLEREENGLYRQCFRCPMTHDTVTDFNVYEASVDFDGERLILTKYLTDEQFGYNATCNFCLAVFDCTGMIFYGEYESSLTTGWDADNYAYHCREMDYDAITVSWD